MKVKHLLLLPAVAPASAFAQSADGNLLDMIQQGGWAMIPLGLCSLAMFILFFYCLMETRRSRFLSTPVLDQTRNQIAQGDLGGACDLLATSGTAAARVLRAALSRIRTDRDDLNFERAGETLVEKLDAEENSAAQWINYLNVVASVAPMIGLLGTVSGMISAFQTIGTTGMGKPELLAGDIGEALITTATGLVIGIPAMIAFFFTRNRLTTRITETHEVTTAILDELAP